MLHIVKQPPAISSKEVTTNKKLTTSVAIYSKIELSIKIKSHGSETYTPLHIQPINYMRQNRDKLNLTSWLFL